MATAPFDQTNDATLQVGSPSLVVEYNQEQWQAVSNHISSADDDNQTSSHTQQQILDAVKTQPWVTLELDSTGDTNTDDSILAKFSQDVETQGLVVVVTDLVDVFTHHTPAHLMESQLHALRMRHWGSWQSVAKTLIRFMQSKEKGLVYSVYRTPEGWELMFDGAIDCAGSTTAVPFRWTFALTRVETPRTAALFLKHQLCLPFMHIASHISSAINTPATSHATKPSISSLMTSLRRVDVSQPVLLAGGVSTLYRELVYPNAPPPPPLPNLPTPSLTSHGATVQPALLTSASGLHNQPLATTTTKRQPALMQTYGETFTPTVATQSSQNPQHDAHEPQIQQQQHQQQQQQYSPNYLTPQLTAGDSGVLSAGDDEVTRIQKKREATDLQAIASEKRKQKKMKL